MVLLWLATCWQCRAGDALHQVDEPCLGMFRAKFRVGSVVIPEGTVRGGSMGFTLVAMELLFRLG